MTNSFYIILPSNAPGFPDNKTNKFKVHLPKKLNFDGPGWVVGLAGIIYPNSWATVGTIEKQYVIVVLKDGKKFRFWIPKGSFLTPKQLENGIYNGMVRDLEQNLRPRRRRAVEVEKEPQLAQPEFIQEDDTPPLYPLKSEKEKRKEEERKNQEVERRRLLDEQRRLGERQRIAEEQRREAERKRNAEEQKRQAEKRKNADEQSREAERQRIAEEQRREVQKRNEESKRQQRIEEENKRQQKILEERSAEDEKRKSDERIKQQLRKESEEREKLKKHGEDSQKATEEREAALITAEFVREEEDENRTITENEIILSYGEFSSIYTVDGKDPHPILRYLHELDNYIYGKAQEEYIKKHQLKWDSKQRMYPNFLHHAEEHIEEFRKIYEEIEYNENYSLRSEGERQGILEIAKGIQFQYLSDIGRFKLKLEDARISYVVLSNQIGYVLGFDPGQAIKNQQLAKYGVDLHGGVSHLCVYLNNGLIESMIIGDTFANLLQVIAVEGSVGQVIEKNYPSPLFHKIMAKDLDVIDIEVRSLTGREVPFEFGEIILTLQFKKTITF